MQHFIALNMKAEIVSSRPKIPARPAVLMGLDYGKARIGIALTNAEQTFIFPHKTLGRTKKLIGTLEIIIQIAKEFNVAAIIIGYPLNADGTESKMCQAVRAFASNLKKHTQLAMIYQDERYTSLDAESDAHAAAKLLERALTQE